MILSGMLGSKHRLSVSVTVDMLSEVLAGHRLRSCDWFLTFHAISASGEADFSKSIDPARQLNLSLPRVDPARAVHMTLKFSY